MIIKMKIPCKQEGGDERERERDMRRRRWEGVNHRRT
jgi:hypothetical protein